MFQGMMASLCLFVASIRSRDHPSMNTTTPWHRLLGMVLTDLFTGRPWRVELEQELALKSQRLDILIIER
jgi:hypothetical protein